MHLYDAAVFLRMSPPLVNWLTRYAPKKGETRKLEFKTGKDGQKYFSQKALRDFDSYLAKPWHSKGDERLQIPRGIEKEIKMEGRFRCVICSHASAQCAHIDPVHNSKNNHPHNLIFLCPNCHDLYDKKKVIKEQEVRSIKKDILETRVSIWRSHAVLLNKIFALIRELEFIREKGKTSQRGIYKKLQDELLQAIGTNARSQTSRRENPAVSKKIKSALHNRNKIDRLIAERTAFLADSNNADCPLCKGTGSHNNWDCPVCRGIGTVDADVLSEIDLSPFEQEECPLCKGTGSHNNWDCPVCRGIGTVDADALSEIDLSPFEQEECPLCKGTGSHNNWDCPVCRGIGTVDADALSEIDLSPFEQEECPLCKGTGSHNNWDCPVCRGIGTVDADALSEIDLSPFEQEECPLCKGTGSHNNWDCPVCRGIGTVDADALSEIDLDDFRLGRG